MVCINNFMSVFDNHFVFNIIHINIACDIQDGPNTKNQFKYMVIARFRSKRRENVKRQIIYDKQFNHYLCITPKGEPTKISISTFNTSCHNIKPGIIIIVAQKNHFVDPIKGKNPLATMGINNNISIRDFKIQQQPEKQFDDGIYFKMITRQIKQLINKICAIKEVEIPNPPQPNHYQFHSINHLNQSTETIPSCMVLCKFIEDKTTILDGKYLYRYLVQTEDKEITIVDCNKSGKPDNQLKDIQQGSNIILCNIKYETRPHNYPRFIYDESSYVIHSFASEINRIMNGIHEEFTIKGVEHLWSKQPTNNNISIQNTHSDGDMNVIVVKGIIQATKIEIQPTDTDVEEKKAPENHIVIDRNTAKHVYVDAHLTETNISSTGHTIHIACYKNAIKQFYDYLEDEHYPLHNVPTNESTRNLSNSYQQNRSAYSKELVIKGDRSNFVNTYNMDIYIPLVKSFFVEYNKKQNVTIRLVKKEDEANKTIYSILDINYHQNHSLNKSENNESSMPVFDRCVHGTDANHNAKTQDTNTSNTHHSISTNFTTSPHKDILPNMKNLTIDNRNKMNYQKQEMINNSEEKDKQFEAVNTIRKCANPTINENNVNENKTTDINTGVDNKNLIDDTVSIKNGTQQLNESYQTPISSDISNTENAAMRQPNTPNSSRTNHRKRSFSNINDNTSKKNGNTDLDMTVNNINLCISPSTTPPGPNKDITSGEPAAKKRKIQGN